MDTGLLLFIGSIVGLLEYKHYMRTEKTLDATRRNLVKKLASCKIDYSDAQEYFKKCDDNESKLILHNITAKSSICKNVLHSSLMFYCSPLNAQLDSLINILHQYHDLNETNSTDFVRLDQRSTVFRIPFFISQFINIFNYGVTYHLKKKGFSPVDSNHNVYIRYDKKNTKTIIVFSGIIGGRLVLARMLKYIPSDYNIIGTVYEEISSKFYEDVVYDILEGYGIKDHVVVYSWSYGTLFANRFITKYQNKIDIKLKVFCDIFGLPLNTLYLSTICGTNNFIEAYRLIKLKVKPFWNGLMMLFLLKSEFIEKRIMTLTLNDYLLWSYDNLNTKNTLMFISNDDIMYDVDNVKRHCPESEIFTFRGGHCAGVNRRSLSLLKQKLIDL
jgi:hypothetical protein